MLELLEAIKKETISYYKEKIKQVPSQGTEQFLKDNYLDVSYIKTIAETIGIEIQDKDMSHPPMIAMGQDEAIMTISALINVVNELEIPDVWVKKCTIRNKELFEHFLDKNLKDYKDKILSSYS